MFTILRKIDNDFDNEHKSEVIGTEKSLSAAKKRIKFDLCDELLCDEDDEDISNPTVSDDKMVYVWNIGDLKYTYEITEHNK